MALSKIDTTNMIEDVPQSKLDNNINFRNIIINGDMSIAQRGTSATGITTTGYHTIDRMRYGLLNFGTWTVSQSTDVPSGQGFANSFKLDCTTADPSLGSANYAFLNYNIEGQDLQYLKKGTSNAESLTLSFWTKSNKTGTYTFELDDNDNNRSISKTYTVDSANTWEKKTITIEGDTTGTLDNDNNTSLRFYFWLGAGSDYTSGTLQTSWQSTTDANRVSSSNVNLGDSTDNEWYITGIQLEAGTTASDFEFLPHDVNLRRCQRYFIREYESVSGDYHCYPGKGQSSNAIRFNFFMSCILRASPSISQSGGGWRVYSDSGASDSSSTATVLYYKLNTSTIALSVAGFSGITDNEIYNIAVRSMTSFDLDAEL